MEGCFCIKVCSLIWETLTKKISTRSAGTKQNAPHKSEVRELPGVQPLVPMFITKIEKNPSVHMDTRTGRDDRI